MLSVKNVFGERNVKDANRILSSFLAKRPYSSYFLTAFLSASISALIEGSEYTCDEIADTTFVLNPNFPANFSQW